MKAEIQTPLIAMISLLFTTGVAWAQQDVHTPQPGSPVRQAIMDVMRLNYYSGDALAAHLNAKKVIFKVLHLKVHGDWALTCVVSVNADGKVIDEHQWALLHHKAGRWINANYFDAIRPYPTEESAQDALSMSAFTIQKILRVFPDAPQAIFPEERMTEAAETDALSRPFVRPGTAEMNDLEFADSELNGVYKRLMATLPPHEQKLLREAQHAWINFRDMEADRITGADGRGGSGFRIFHAVTRTKLTRERTATLQNDLNGPAQMD